MHTEKQCHCSVSRGFCAGRILAAALSLIVVFTACSSSSMNSEASMFSVTSLTLMNADTDQPIAEFDPLPSGARLNLARLPTRNLSIRANTSPDVIGKVRFELVKNNAAIIDDGPPYSMPGDSKSFFSSKVNYIGKDFPQGSHVLVVTPHNGNHVGRSLTVTYEVVDEGGS